MPSFNGARLSSAVEAFLAARYPDALLTDLASREIQWHEGFLAGALLQWRMEAGWPSPEIIGEERCVACHKLMGEESSAFADETVCAGCAGTETDRG